jgi:prepilin signal peptidase PulO-like enzyme (type II secretory pathway)
MIDINSIFEFSRNHCLAICGFLVPANLLATLQTLILVGLNRPRYQVQRATAIAIAFALVMILHVYTWFAVGVVMAPTYILLFLGSVCLCLNMWALWHRESMTRSLHALYLSASGMLGRMKTANR